MLALKYCKPQVQDFLYEGGIMMDNKNIIQKINSFLSKQEKVYIQPKKTRPLIGKLIKRGRAEFRTAFADELVEMGLLEPAPRIPGSYYERYRITQRGIDVGRKESGKSSKRKAK